jgi:hypothetical protein
MGRIRDLRILTAIVLVLVAVAAVLYACQIARFAVTAISSVVRRAGRYLTPAARVLAAHGSVPKPGAADLRTQVH